MAGQNGGKRPGAGLKKGFKFPATIAKEVAREALRDLVKAHLAEMTQAQIDASKGLKYIVIRDKKTGTFKPVSKERYESLDADEYELLEVWDKIPSTAAFTDLLNRTLDKPKEHVELTGANGGPLISKWEK